MPRQTQTYPRALLSLLQLKDTGAFGFDDNWRGVVELIDILGSDRVSEQRATTNTIVSGSAFVGQFLTVPADELWIMTAAQAGIIIPNAAEWGQAMVQHTKENDTTAAGAVVAEADRTSTIDGERVHASVVYPRPIIFRPGDGLAGRFAYSGAGLATGVIAAEFYKFGPGGLGASL